MFATTNVKEPNAAPNVPAYDPRYPDGRNYDTLDDLERSRAAENSLQVSRAKQAFDSLPEVTVLVRADQRTFELRERLKAAGLHWLKGARAWSGSVPCKFVPQMEAEGLQVVPVVPEGHPLDRFAEREPVAPNTPQRVPARPPQLSELVLSRPLRARDRSRPRKAAPVRVSAQEQAAAFLPAHGWDVRDIMANLADDDRAEDERRVERHLRDLRSRVKAVRAKLAADPTIAPVLASDRQKARAFYAIHAVTAEQVRQGVPDLDVRGMDWEDLADALRGHFPAEPVGVDWSGEEAQREAAILPGSEAEA